VFVDQILHREQEIHVIGCGNAPLSPDMYHDGYTKILNSDLSPVVIEQQRAAFPHMQWTVMDSLNTPLADESVEAVIDKRYCY
jgi:hypothetical protein